MRGLTQTDLARMAGVEKATVNYAESGKRVPQPATLDHFATVLDIPKGALESDAALLRELARVMGLADLLVSSGAPPPPDLDQPITRRELQAEVARAVEQLRAQPPFHGMPPSAPTKPEIPDPDEL